MPSTTVSTPRARASATRSNSPTLPPPDFGLRNSTALASPGVVPGPVTSGAAAAPDVAPLGVDGEQAGHDAEPDEQHGGIRPDG